jgi:arylsulfatase A-like enzyme
MPPHGPYIAPPDVKHRFHGDDPPNAWRSDYPFEGVEIEQRKGAASWPQERFINLYDGNMVYADWAVGEVERLLREAGLFENTLLIVTADHGEAFGEHGYRGHTFSAFDESIHVPLLMRLPGERPASARVSGLTQVIDLLPTILDLFGVEYPAGEIQGRSLLPLLSGDVDEVNRYVFARAGGDPPSYIVRSRDHMLLLYRGGRLRALYDLEADPRQTRNVIADQPEPAAELLAVFQTFAQSQAAPPMDFIDPDAPPPDLPDAHEVHVTDEMQRSLRALGYLK